MSNTKFTVFTPTYNRCRELRNVYTSLINQNYKDFEWVVMDDGSMDETREVVQKWIDENKIIIKYYFQKNQGRFAAHNNAVKYFDGELVIIVDSDNYLKNRSLKKYF